MGSDDQTCTTAIVHRTSPSYANSIQIDTFYLYINFGLNSACKNQHLRFWKVSINTKIKVFSVLYIREHPYIMSNLLGLFLTAYNRLKV